MKPLYVAVGALIEKNEKFLFLKRSPDRDVGANLWEGVTGRLEVGEDPEAGIRREVLEEANLEIEVIMPIDTSFFYRGSKEFPMVFIVYWCRYIKGDLKMNWEHTEFKWIAIEEGRKSDELTRYDKERLQLIEKLKNHLPGNFTLKDKTNED
ncbi:MAG: NUDIX domain-containing protein [Candidatus Heimdallarchaeota archaeon]|nr:NUDIX domain-containing protein [Candidatus Heimdallarchaeota archaeon]